MKARPRSHGPFFADQLRSGDTYELSKGNLIECLPTGGRGSKAESAGARVLSTDPDVEDFGVDTGYSPTPGTLRAPDLSIGTIPDAPGWVKGTPRLAVEYADTGQDEADLATKIDELLGAGTEFIWVVRLVGPRRVEVHRPDEPMRLAGPGETLEAPGILRHPVAVEALYDMEVANEVAFRNLLERHGYQSLDEVRDAGKNEGRVEGRVEGELTALRTDLLAVLEARGLEPDETSLARVASSTDSATLRRWLVSAATAQSAADVFRS